MTNKNCPCGSEKKYEACCGRYHSKKEKAPTAESVMRARYCAYVVGDIDYVDRTHDKDSRHDFDRAAAETWSKQSEWLGLEIVGTEKGQPGDLTGEVEFKCNFKHDGKELNHHEVSHFRFDEEDGEWYYSDGKEIKSPIVRSEPKIGRNDPCHCGSGKKFKKCHG